MPQSHEHSSEIQLPDSPIGAAYYPYEEESYRSSTDTLADCTDNLRHAHARNDSVEARINLINEGCERLKENTPAAADLLDFLHESSASLGREDRIEYGYQLTHVAQVLRGMDTRLLRDAYHDTEQETNSLRAALVETAVNPVLINHSLHVLQKIYGSESILDLLEPKSAASVDPTLEALSQKENFAGSILLELRVESDEWNNEWGTLPDDKIDIKKRDWSKRFLKVVTGLDRSRAREVTYNAHSRTLDEDGTLNTTKLIQMLALTHDRAKYLGKERTDLLREKAGIVSLDYYAPAQLETMAKLIEGDAETIKHLQEGDVTAVFIDARGDYNGAFLKESQIYATDSGRSLFFEINRPSDFYRHLTLLKQRGIKPSTLALAAHGGPGSIHLGNSREEGGFKIMNRDQITDAKRKQKSADSGRHHLTSSTGFVRVVRDMMQDSRGIDDNEEAIGRRRIILGTCSQAASALVWRKRNPRDFIATIPRQESMAESMTVQAAYPTLDVIAGGQSLSLAKTAAGVQLRSGSHVVKAQYHKYRDGTAVILEADEIKLNREVEHEPFVNNLRYLGEE